jgi:RimJ/RimL family protein N-acetyltransferase
MNNLNFLPFDLEAVALVKPYLALEKSRFCDLTAGNLYMWRNDLETSYVIEDETLLLRKEYEVGKFAYLFPLGKDVDGGLKKLEQYAISHKEILSFFALSEEEASYLAKRYHHNEVTCKDEWGDYLYEASSLINYPGKKYSSKRHNASHFHKEHPLCEFKKAQVEDVPALLEFLKAYTQENEGRDISEYELSLTKEILLSFSPLQEEIGYYLENGKILGFAYGEKKGDTLYAHIEKALREYEGIYQALTQDYLKNFGDGAIYENREEDDGNEGLREAKEQLHPLAKLQKRFLSLTNPIDLFKSPLSIAGARLDLKMMKEKDEDNYFTLATSEERNQYWGYDYHQDLKEGEKETPAFFYEDIKKDYASKDCFSYMIKSKDGAFMGEAVLYDFRNDGSGEIGLRLLSSYEGQGYAKEAGLLIIKLSREIGLSSLRYESYLQNGRSLLLAKSLGFCKKGEDNLKAYFSLKL